MRFLGLLALLVQLGETPALAQASPRPLTIGSAYSIRSALLNEDRDLLVSVPENYERTTVRYPVLYVLDGGSNFLHATATTRSLVTARNRIPEMIVGAVPNTNRNRDMSPGAGAVLFERVLAEEIIPWVEANFRASSERIVAGHSRSAMFVTHALLHRPSLFTGWIALSAPLYRYDSLSQQAAAGLPRAGGPDRSVYLGVGADESADMRRGMQEFNALLPRLSPALRASFVTLPDEHHNSMFAAGLREALEDRYLRYRFPLFETIAELDSLGGWSVVEAHYGGVAPEDRVAQAARLLVQARRLDEAAVLLATYRERYPAMARNLERAIAASRAR